MQEISTWSYALRAAKLAGPQTHLLTLGLAGLGVTTVAAILVPAYQVMRSLCALPLAFWLLRLLS